MFVSLLLPLPAKKVEAPYLWVLYKQITHLSPAEVHFVATPEYFKAPDDFVATGRWDMSPASREMNGFLVPSRGEVDSYRRELLPAGLFDSLRQQGLSDNEITRLVLSERLPELEALLRPIFGKLSAQGTLEAALSWHNVPSLSTVAAEFGVPVIHNEQGPLRGPCYHWTAYFDFHGVNGGTEAASRLAAFRSEPGNVELPLLSKRQLLQLFLKDPDLPAAQPADQFEIGVPLQVENDTNMIAFSQGWDNQRLMEEVSAIYGREKSVFRRHPGGLRDYPDTLCTADDSPDAAAFIRRCRSIATINSSVGLEALLWGRKTFILGDSPFAQAAANSLAPGAAAPTAEEELTALNFLLLGYLIPYEFLFEPAYLRWRLSNPAEREICAFHLSYLQARERLLQHPFQFRPDGDLCTTGLLKFLAMQEYKDSLMLDALMQRRDADVERRLEEAYKAHRADLDRLLNTLSWRVTKPLRGIAGFLHRRGLWRRPKP